MHTEAAQNSPSKNKGRPGLLSIRMLRKTRMPFSHSRGRTISEDRRSVLPVPNPQDPVAGPSNGAEQAEVIPDESQNAPTYAQSPAKDKRKRLEELATARKQKRRL